MKNKHFPDNEDFTTADTGLIAMMDVIRDTLYNYVSNLQSGGKKRVFKYIWTASKYPHETTYLLCNIHPLFLLICLGNSGIKANFEEIY